MMKKFIVFFILLMLVSFIGCGSGGSDSSLPMASNNEGSNVITPSPAVSSDEERTVITPSINFKAQYVRTNGYHSEATYPDSTVINSRSELNDYINNNKSNYDLESDFLDAVSRYDDAYFADRILLLILLQEKSGSISHTVTAVTYSENETLVTIKRHVPGEGVDGDCMMTQWHIMIELKKDSYKGQPVNVKFE